MKWVFEIINRCAHSIKSIQCLGVRVKGTNTVQLTQLCVAAAAAVLLVSIT
jgi:hypothetical protein